MASSTRVTNWDDYYARPFPATKFTRRYFSNVIVATIQKFVVGNQNGPFSILEFGGANSCYIDRLRRTFHPKQYCAADLNVFGLDLLRQKLGGSPDVSVVRADVLDPQANLPCSDLVMSFGLIEHFDTEGTRTAIENHFRFCRPGGIVMISYPTPTPLYRMTRSVAESLGIWKFPDERPLRDNEVLGTAQHHGTLLHRRLLWPLVLTQRLLAWRKLNEPSDSKIGNAM